MPPKAAKAGAKKRPLDEVDANSTAGVNTEANAEGAASAAKKPRTAAAAKAANKPAAKPKATAAPQPLPMPSTIRIPRGPKGQCFIPNVMPEESVKALKKLLIPDTWIVGIDGIPGREMTLGNREWWEFHAEWLEANKKGLGLKAADWKMRDVAMAKAPDLKEDEGNHDFDFICLPEPRSDEEEEEEDDDDKDEDGDGRDAREGAKKAPNATKDIAVAGKLASLHPDYTFVSTMRGRDRANWWTLEAQKRDQDCFSMYVYNDYTAYGGMEVMENIFSNFTRVCDPSTEYRDIWCEVEGLAMYLQRGWGDFTMCDDPEKGGEVVRLAGYMTMAALQELHRQGVFAAKGPIPNIGFILSLLMKRCWELGDVAVDSKEITSWVYCAIEMALVAGITIAGANGFDSVIKEIQGAGLGAKDPSLIAKWDKVDFPKRLEAYRKGHGGCLGPGFPPTIGGDFYDITTMTAAERKQHSYR